MNRRLLVTIGILTLLLLIAGVAYFLSGLRDEQTPQGSDEPLFGTPGEGGIPPTTTPGSEPEAGEGEGTVDTSTPAAKVTLTKISAAPVAGSVIFRKEGKEYLRYVERASGHVYELELTQNAPVRITNTTIPAVQEAIWLPNGSGVYLALLDETGEKLRTFYGVPTKGAEEGGSIGVLAGSFMQNLISPVSPSQDGVSIFYFERDSSGARAAVARADNTGKSFLFNPATITEFLVTWLSTREVLLTTKPSGGVLGYAHVINTQNGTDSKLLGDISGLMTLPSVGGAYILYAESSGQNITLSVYSFADGEVIPVGIGTIPDKCVWGAREDKMVYCAVPFASSGSGVYPDVWYQGLVSFSDNLWSIDAENGGARLLVSVRDYSEEPFDMIDLKRNTDSSVFTFINKKDGSLWKLNIDR